MYRVKIGYRYSCVFGSWADASRFVCELLNSLEQTEEIKVERFAPEYETEEAEE